ncbi:MAG: flagellum-specific ATP synthase FliI, partial [Gammaproteobacteria bacterium]
GIDGRGSITAFYPVLTEADDPNDPVADSARAILDGHIVLSRRLAERGQYPAIDVEASISRVMSQITSREHQQAAKTLRHYYSLYEQNADLFNVGAYQRGANPELDRAVALRPALLAFLNQDMREAVDFVAATNALAAALAAVLAPDNKSAGAPPT